MFELIYVGLKICEDFKYVFDNHKRLLLKVKEELESDKKYGFFKIYFEDKKYKELSEYINYLKGNDLDEESLNLISEIEKIRDMPVILDGNKDIDDIIKIIENNDLDIFDYIDFGESSNVYAYDDYCIKIFKEDTGNYMYSNKDAYILECLQDLECVPKLYAYKHEKYLVMDFIDGKPLSDLIGEKRNLSGVRRGLRRELYKIYKIGIAPKDLHMYNIICDVEGNYKLIDFGMYFRDTSFYDGVEVDSFKTKEDIYPKLNILLNNLMSICEKHLKLCLEI